MIELNERNQRKKVCIVIPIYNAEKYLGYCLNSVMSQTYTNWTAILVDDGSTDSSGEICSRYVNLDSRFRYVAKPNGGVSSARNAGLKLAEGDYLAFLDSDDYLAPNALERQVSLAEQYHTPLVIMDILMVDFSNPRENQIRLTSAWLKNSPCLLTSEEFKAKKMRLVWFTVLLECLHAKLYDLSLWKQLDLQFPEDLSLGEDFLTNMKYFDACQNVVFVQECGHYYNCIAASSSLTQKYRPNLFELKMYLNEELERHLNSLQTLSKEEQDAFYCYVASNGLTCLEKAILDSKLEPEALIRRLEEMLNHALFYESLLKAGFIPDRFCPYLEYIRNRDYINIIRGVRGELSSQSNAAEEPPMPSVKAQYKDQHESDDGPTSGAPGLLNRILCRMLQSLSAHIRNDIWKERFSRWESEIRTVGILLTIRQHCINHQRLNRHDLLMLHGRIDFMLSEFQNLQEQNNLLQTQNEILHNQINLQKHELLSIQSSRFTQIEKQFLSLENTVSSQLSSLHTAAQSMAQSVNTSISRMITESTDNLTARLSESSTALRNDITGHTWNSEQRILQYTYQRDVNELRQKKKAIMIATAEHRNIGDAAITLAEQIFLRRYFPDYYQVEISTYEFTKQETFLHTILNEEDVIFINGGGNIGNAYIEEEELHRKIVESFPAQKIVIFPQTVHFSDTDSGIQELEKSAQVYNRHPDLTLYLRGQESLRFAQTHFPNVQSILMPDMTHILQTDYHFDRSGILLCLREDDEGILSAEQKQKLVYEILAQNGQIAYSSNMYETDIRRDIRGKVVREELMRFAKHQVVVTDRLHGMLFAAITATPCVVISSFNHKIREYYETFFRDCSGIFFIENRLDLLPEKIALAMQSDHCKPSILDEQPHSTIRKHLFEGKGIR